MSRTKQDEQKLRTQILKALEANNAYRQAAAQALGISLSALHRHIRRLQMSDEIQALEKKLGRRTWAPGRKAAPIKVRKLSP